MKPRRKPKAWSDEDLLRLLDAVTRRVPWVAIAAYFRVSKRAVKARVAQIWHDLEKSEREDTDEHPQ